MTINECFASIQGEGKYMGVPVIFLRTQGCPVKCSFCDSSTTWKDSEEDRDFKYILNDVQRASMGGKITTVVITGGEPTAQPDIYNVVKQLRFEGFRCHLETSGWADEISRGYFDHVVCSPKPNLNYRVSSGQVDELKYVIGEEDIKNINTIIPGHVREQFAGRIWLQPKANGFNVPESALRACHKLAMTDPRLRAGIQLHKYYNVQ